MEIINQYDGYWHLPKIADEDPIIVHGSLKITNSNELFLEIATSKSIIDRAFPQMNSMSYNINQQIPIPIIVGYGNNKADNKNAKFTLIDLVISGYSGSNDFLRITFQAEKALMGCFLKSKGELTFQNSMLKFKGLDEWLDKHGFTFKPNMDSKYFETTVKYTQPEPIELIHNDSFKAYFWFRANAPSMPSKGKVTITQSVYLNIEFKEQQSIETHEKLAGQFQNFFSLALGDYTKRVDFELRFLSNKIAEDKKVYNPYVFVLLPDEVIKGRTKTDEESDYFPGIFNYAKIEDRVQDTFQKWLDLNNTNELVLEQFFDTYYRRNLHFELRFVNYLSILEIYHLGKYKEDRIPLSKKLNQLLSPYVQILKTLKVDLKPFATNMVAIRKYYVHGNKTQISPQDIEQKNILILSFRLEHLIKILLMIDIGFTEEEIVKIIERKPWNWGIHN